MDATTPTTPPTRDTVDRALRNLHALCNQRQDNVHALLDRIVREATEAAQLLTALGPAEAFPQTARSLDGIVRIAKDRSFCSANFWLNNLEDIARCARVYFVSEGV